MDLPACESYVGKLPDESIGAALAEGVADRMKRIGALGQHQLPLHGLTLLAGDVERALRVRADLHSRAMLSLLSQRNPRHALAYLAHQGITVALAPRGPWGLRERRRADGGNGPRRTSRRWPVRVRHRRAARRRGHREWRRKVGWGRWVAVDGFLTNAEVASFGPEEDDARPERLHHGEASSDEAGDSEGSFEVVDSADVRSNSLTRACPLRSP